MTNPTFTSVEELPAWLVHRTRHTGILGAGKLRIVLIALVCIVLGFVVTTSFGPAAGDSGDEIDPMLGGYGVDVLDGPGTYGKEIGGVKGGGGGHESQQNEAGEALGAYREPSIKGALSDLSHAVSGKLKSWKPSSVYSYSNNNGGSDGVGSDGGETNKVANSKAKNMTNSAHAVEEILSPDRDNLGVRTRVGKCTIILYGAGIYERSVRSHEAHDRMHGYPLHVLRHGLMDDVWSKPAYILSILLRELARPEDERLQWLLWVDADTILLNPYIAIETFLPPSPEFDDVHLLVSNDWNGLNNGVFPIRVNQWAVDLFSAIVAYRQFRPDDPLVFRDQSAMDTLLHEPKFEAHAVEAPQRWFNAYQGEHNETLQPFQVRRGDFLVHFAGVGDRNERMSYWLERAEAHLPEWEMEIQHTTYPAEVRDFWQQQRQLRSSRAQNLVATITRANDLLLQTDSHMSEYKDRLQDDAVKKILEQQKKLRETLGKDGVVPTQIEDGMKQLTEVSCRPFHPGVY